MRNEILLVLQISVPQILFRKFGSAFDVVPNIFGQIQMIERKHYYFTRNFDFFYIINEI